MLFRASNLTRVLQLNANNRRRKDIHTLPLPDRDLLDAIGYKERILDADKAILLNAAFLNDVIASPEIFSHDPRDGDSELKGNDQDDTDERVSAPCECCLVLMFVCRLLCAPKPTHLLVRIHMSTARTLTPTIMSLHLNRLEKTPRKVNTGRRSTTWRNYEAPLSSSSETGAPRFPSFSVLE